MATVGAVDMMVQNAQRRRSRDLFQIPANALANHSSSVPCVWIFIAPLSPLRFSLLDVDISSMPVGMEPSYGLSNPFDQLTGSLINVRVSWLTGE